MSWQDKNLESFHETKMYSCDKKVRIRELSDTRKDVILFSMLMFCVSTVLAGILFQKNVNYIGIAFSIVSLGCVISSLLAYFHFPKEKNHEA